ncbi:response regulator [[Clostridium] spiroforme]|nr:response regulator [Thomasclavelia spiroformis]
MNKKNTILSIVINALTLLCVTVILVVGITMVRTKLLKNAQNMGMSLAQSYALEEEKNIQMFENFLDMGAQYINQISQNDDSTIEIQHWMGDYFSKLTNILGDKIVDPYAVIDGKIIAETPWEGDDTYDYQNSTWYQLAINNKGKICFTDAYQDAITGDIVFTACVSLDNEGDVFAMDIYPEMMHTSENGTYELIENSSLFVCDSHGNLIFTTVDKYSQNKLKEYVNSLYKEIESGKLYDYDTSFTDTQGINRGVYYAQVDNGWMVVITIPISVLLMEDGNLIIYGLIITGVVLIVILAIMFIRDLLNYRKIKEADSTIEILSDSFYAIYRLDIQNGTYKAIKYADDMEKRLHKEGKYEDLLATIRTVVQKGTYKEFDSCFSLESIRQRVKENIMDYGGDYQRLFGDSYRWVNIRTLYNKDISPNDIILCFKDIDVEKKQELQHTLLLEEALETSKKNVDAKSVFFNNMSHDLRTPLNAIIGFTDLAISNDSFDKVKDYLQKIAFSGKQMLTLVNDILELSKMESGNRHIDYKVFDLEKCIYNVCDIFEAKKQTDHKTFNVHVDLIHQHVSSDETKIVQILTNIISNSFKYTEPHDTITFDVKELEYYQSYKVEFVITDTGIGMSKEFLERIFEPYARETHFSKNVVVGTGLGMPIVKNLIEILSGEITIESEVGKGTKTVISLPIYLPEKEEITEVSDQSADPEILKGKRVLLVEDNELNIEIATDILELNDVEVVQAHHGQEALELFVKSAPFTFDLILMDMQMPVMDGCSATEKIRALDRPDSKSVPIIAVSANAFSEDIDKALRVGMNAHLPKPINFDALCKLMIQYLK